MLIRLPCESLSSSLLTSRCRPGAVVIERQESTQTRSRRTHPPTIERHRDGEWKRGDEMLRRMAGNVAMGRIEEVVRAANCCKREPKTVTMALSLSAALKK